MKLPNIQVSRPLLTHKRQYLVLDECVPAVRIKKKQERFIVHDKKTMNVLSLIFFNTSFQTQPH